MFRWRLAFIVPLAAMALAAGSATLPAAASASGTFTLTASMHAARICQSATLLPNGQVLAAGVGAGSGPSAELYDPATGGWTVTGAMISPTDGHTATLLPDGQVLVTGGSTSGCAYGGVSSAELYNPAAGTWTGTGTMTTGRVDQTATLLNNGQVLITGGMGSAIPSSLSSAELYNPATGKFTATGSMGAARVNQDAISLHSGQVLVTGGATSGPFAELYNPATGQWSPASGGLAACTPARECRPGSAATLLGDGDVLVTGGYANLATTYPATTGSAMLYDPATNSWAATGSMSTSRADQSSTLLPDGQVLVAGGEAVTKGKTTLLSSAELYTP